jgi:hypothetical protein
MNCLVGDINGLNNLLINIKGQNAWGAKLGHGSFLTIEFGKALMPNPETGAIHGEWHLWIYMCSWRIEKNGCFLVGCEDKRSKIGKVIEQINGNCLISFNVLVPSLDAILQFENKITLNLFSIISEDNDGGGQHWMLFMPNKNILVAGPGSRWTVERTE